VEFPRYREYRGAGGTRLLKGLRADAPEIAMAPAAIIEHLDVVEQIYPRLITSPATLLSDPFLLQGAEEGFREDGAPTVGSPAQPVFHVMSSTEPLEVGAAVARFLV